jgi:hypothetical protein
LSDIFPTWNGLKQGNDPSPLLFNFASECAIARFEQTRRETKEFADSFNLLAESIHSTLGFILVTQTYSGLEVNAERTKYMFMSSSQNAGHRNTGRGNKSFGSVAQFKYL